MKHGNMAQCWMCHMSQVKQTDVASCDMSHMLACFCVLLLAWKEKAGALPAAVPRGYFAERPARVESSSGYQTSCLLLPWSAGEGQKATSIPGMAWDL